MAQRLLQHLLYKGRRHRAAEHRAHLRFIHQDEAHKFRIIRRGKADERCNELAFSDLAVFILLCRARFTADAVSRDCGIAPAPARYDALRDLPHQSGSLLADHAAHDRGFILKDHRSVLCDDAIQHIRLHQVAAVHDCGYGRCKLQGRHGDALAEADAGERIFRDVFLVRHDAACFARDPAPRGSAKAKGVNVFIKRFHAHGLRHRHKGRVAGVLRHLKQVLLPMAAGFPAADLLAVHDVIPRAVDAEVFIDRVAVKRRCKRYELER